MAGAYSQDLRDRVIDAALVGLPARLAAVQFRVGIATAIGWVGRARQTGERAARRQGQPRRSKLDAHRTFLLGLIEATPDVTLLEMQERLEVDRDITASVGTIWTFLDRCRLTFKKVRPCRRTGPARPSGAARGMVRGPARSRPGPAGLHRRDWRLHQHGPPARPRAEGSTAAGRHPEGPLEIHDLCSGPAAHGHCRAHDARWPDEPVRIPGLRAAGARADIGAWRIVLADNLPTHKGPLVRKAIEAAGASLVFLLAYNPDFNLVENAFAKLKALLRKVAERTIRGPWRLTGQFLDTFTPQECANYFAAAGYDPD